MDKTKLEQSIATLQQTKDTWAGLPLVDKIQLLRQLSDGTIAVAHRQVAAALAAKGVSPGTHAEGEEYLAGPVITVRNLRLLRETLTALATKGHRGLSRSAFRRLANGQIAADVFPQNALDKFLYPNFSAEVWHQQGVSLDEAHRGLAGNVGEPHAEGAVALVLGAGNVPSIGPLDVIYKMFVEGQVCLLKLNPVNDYLGPFVEEAFAPLITAGYLRLAYGGGDVGAFLCQHEGIDEIHITGSDRTHDAIVFGVGAAGEKRKAENSPTNSKRITSELGNVSPIIVIPGDWSDSELKFQAENVATQMTNNAGFNCNAARVLITWKDWPQRGAFLDQLREILRRLPGRTAYYPGAKERHQTFVAEHPGRTEYFGPVGGDILPWTLIVGVPATETDNVCFRSESFCAVTAETSLDGSGATDFLRRAVDFCNDTLWGTLNAGIIVDPRTAKALGDELERGIANLRYGTISINHWAAMGYAMGVTPWGAYPGHTNDDIQSGVGIVHNSLLLDNVEKTVIRGPFKMFPKPAWFVTNKRTHKIAPKLIAFEESPKLAILPGIIVHALRG
jgi:acyl-CoA reductase-like NAD-dependent aldehyde dehydrogenase